MKITLDPSNLRTSMELWRQAVDMTIPVHDDFKIHFITQREAILANMSKTAGIWASLLRACAPDPADTKDFGELVGEVQSFKQWADEGLEALRLLVN